MRRNNFFKNRFGMKFRNPDEPGDGGSVGGDGGGGFGDESIDTFVPEGGTYDQDAGHSFEPQSPQSSDAQRAQQLLAQPEDTKISTADIRSLLRLDLPKPAKPAEPAPKPTAQTATPQPQAQQPAAAPQAPQQPAGVEAVAAAIQEGFKNLQPQAPAQPANEQPPAPPAFYGQVKPPMQVAPQIMQALFGENVDDNTSTAMGHLINGMMNQVVNDLMPMVYQLVQQTQGSIQQQIPQIIQQQQTTMTAQQRFFSKYEELNKPAFAGVVDEIAKQVKAQWKAQNKPVKMDDEYFDAIGNAVHAHLKNEFGFDIPRARKPQPQAPIQVQNQQPQQSQQPKPRFWTGGGARPPAAEHLNGQSADLRNFV